MAHGNLQLIRGLAERILEKARLVRASLLGPTSKGQGRMKKSARKVSKGKGSSRRRRV